MEVDQIVFWCSRSRSAARSQCSCSVTPSMPLFLVVNFFTIAVFYLVLGASFLFAVQIIVYAGAIMVLFLFVIMLLGVDREESLLERLKGQRVVAIALGVGIAVELIVAIERRIGFATKAPPDFDEVVNRGGNAAAITESCSGVLLPVRGHLGAPDRRGDRRRRAGVAQTPGDHRADASEGEQAAAMLYLVLRGRVRDALRDRNSWRARPQERARDLHVGRAPAQRRPASRSSRSAGCTAT